MSILIKNGRVITATDDYVADILIEGETVKAIGKDLSVKADKEIDAAGKLVFPGGIDPHVHLDMPFMGTFPLIIMKREQEQPYSVVPPW
jgi:dihydropyrimidinase